MTSTRTPAVTSVAEMVPKPAARRWESLDGLRGLAALVVVLHHALLTSPPLAEAYFGGPMSPTGSTSWWLTYTPLHLVWAGPEAVLVFFVLSGFVLTLPVLAVRRYSWSSYYPRRVIRIYGPVMVSLALAAALITAVPRTNVPGLSPWMFLHTLPNSFTQYVLDATLMSLPPSQANTPLWSLYYELLFSAALPVVVLIAVRLRRAWPVLVLVLAWVVLRGASTGSLHLQFLPIFVLGVIMAVQREQLASVAHRLRSRRWGHAAWWLLTVVSLVLLSSFWWLQNLVSEPAEVFRLSRLTVAAGASLLVFVCGFWDGAAFVLRSRGVQLLGTISFSWYLTHEPIVVTVGFILQGHPHVLVPVLSLPLTIAVGWVFHRVVERPFHLLAKRVGGSARARPVANDADVAHT